MSKGESKNVRFDPEIQNALEDRVAILSMTKSEFIRVAVKEALGMDTSKLIIKSNLAAKEDLSLLMGEGRKLDALFRHAKSRLSVPRPISPDDAEGIKQWQDAQAVVDDFFKQTAACLRRLEIVTELFSGLKETDIPILSGLKKNLAPQFRGKLIPSYRPIYSVPSSG
jgi:hypothetical protein